MRWSSWRMRPMTWFYSTSSYQIRLARIRAVLRRIEGYPTSGLSFGPLEAHTDIREIQANGVYLRFTPREYKFIELLVRKRGMLRPYDRLLRIARGPQVSIRNGMST
jgi:DNA-binding response OmpR family regulator